MLIPQVIMTGVIYALHILYELKLDFNAHLCRYIQAST